MALGLPRVTGVCFNPVLTIGSCRCQVMADYSVRFPSNSTADTEPFDQRFVARLIDTGEVKLVFFTRLHSGPCTSE